MLGYERESLMIRGTFGDNVINLRSLPPAWQLHFLALYGITETPQESP